MMKNYVMSNKNELLTAVAGVGVVFGGIYSFFWIVLKISEIVS